MISGYMLGIKSVSAPRSETETRVDNTCGPVGATRDTQEEEEAEKETIDQLKLRCLSIEASLRGVE